MNRFQIHHTCAFCGRPYLLNTGTFVCECGATIHRGKIEQIHIMPKVANRHEIEEMT